MAFFIFVVIIIFCNNLTITLNDVTLVHNSILVSTWLNHKVMSSFMKYMKSSFEK